MEVLRKYLDENGFTNVDLEEKDEQILLYFPAGTDNKAATKTAIKAFKEYIKSGGEKAIGVCIKRAAL